MLLKESLFFRDTHKMFADGVWFKIMVGGSRLVVARSRGEGGIGSSC